MAVTSRKPSAGDGPKPKGNRKSQGLKRSWSAPARPATAPTRRSSTLKKNPRRAASLRPFAPPSRPFHFTSVAITDLDIPLESRRLVLIDGENVSYNDITDQYLANRIYQAYQWFTANGHRAMVVLPEYLTRKLIGQTPAMRMEVVREIADGPYNHSNNIPFELTLLQRAQEEEAAIVSERQFQNSFENHLEIVKGRVIGFTFFKESIFIPVDPYGLRGGPWLRDILRK